MIQLFTPCFVAYLIYYGGGESFWALFGREVNSLETTHATLLMVITIANEATILIDNVFIWQNGALNAIDSMLFVFVGFHGFLHASVVIPAFLCSDLQRWMVIVFIFVYVFAGIWEQVADYQLSSFVRAKQSGLTDKKVMDTGLWSVCRHPNYLGNQFKWTSFALLSGSVWPAVAWHFAFIFWFFAQAMPAHEGHMSSKYGEEWKDYCKRVPYYYPRIRSSIAETLTTADEELLLVESPPVK
jgi:steroid 5-alpha reductase family enzyme